MNDILSPSQRNPLQVSDNIRLWRNSQFDKKTLILGVFLQTLRLKSIQKSRENVWY